jgi:tetraacyldisaccharide 4'-kinase
MGSFERHWDRLTPVSVALLPLGLLFCLVVRLRRRLYLSGILSRVRLAVPVIVVGNITVGGTGKTPLVLWIAELLKRSGYRPGIVTRGYHGTSRHWPRAVTPSADAGEVGDEAVLLARYSGCPVMAGPDRVADGRLLIEQGCTVLISDDGLQHYRLHRDLEIAVIDGARRFGNRLCLPAGPLREPIGRLQTVSMCVTNGAPEPGEVGMSLDAGPVYRLQAPDQHANLNAWRADPVHAVAGIGNPERFFTSLRALGLKVIPHAFPDHHDFQAADVDFNDDHPVIMTEKDAVKCQAFAKPHHWVLPVTAQPETELADRILNRLKDIKHG